MPGGGRVLSPRRSSHPLAGLGAGPSLLGATRPPPCSAWPSWRGCSGQGAPAGAREGGVVSASNGIGKFVVLPGSCRSRAVVRLARRGKERDRVAILLYPEDARPGASPLVAVPIRLDAPIEPIGRGATLMARGTPSAGHAMVLDVDGEIVPCAVPAWVPTVLRTRYLPALLPRRRW